LYLVLSLDTLPDGLPLFSKFVRSIESGIVGLVASSVLEYENSRNPYPLKQEAMNRYLQMAEARQIVNEAIRQRSEELGHNGLKAVDALHVACAEVLRSDYFITCDKRLINRCARLMLKVVNPVDFVLEVNGDDQSQE
jgi:predicted nucleic acid-binding protein